jgi:hypothetical protein
MMVFAQGVAMVGDTEPDYWICVVCGYSTNSETNKKRHEEEGWFTINPEKEHEMAIHPEHQ